MKKKLILLLILSIFCMSIFVTGCGNDTRTKIVLITDETGLDEYHSEQVYASLKQQSKVYNYKLSVITPKSENTYSDCFNEAVKNGADLIVCSRPSLETELVISAKNNADIDYAIVGATADINIDGVQDVPNVYSIVFSKPEEGFISGIYAAMNTTTRKIAFIGTDEFLSIIQFESSYKAGAKCIGSDIEVYVEYINETVAADEITSKIKALIDNGCDVIFTINNSNDIIDTAKAGNIKVLSKDYLYNDYLSFASYENISACMDYMCGEYFNGTFKGQIKTFGFADTGCLSVVYADESDQSANAIDQWVTQIKNGTIIIPTTRDDFNNFAVPSAE